MRIQPAGQYAQLDLSGDSGSSFPSGPSDGQLFYRTDTNILYEYSVAASRWLSVDRKYLPFTLGRILNNSGSTGIYGFAPIFEDVYLESWQSVVHVGSTNTGSAYWTVELVEQTSAEASTTVSSFSTSADSASNNVTHSITIASVIATASDNLMYLNLTKTGSPSAIDLASLLVLRSAG